MRFLRAREIPGRLATGAFILHSGLEKWKGDEARAKAVHGMAANAFPILKDIPPTQFLRLQSAGEIAGRAALVVPVVPSALAGAWLPAMAMGTTGTRSAEPTA